MSASKICIDWGNSLVKIALFDQNDKITDRYVLNADEVIDHFNADDDHEAKALLDFLYEKAVLSTNKHRRKKELRAILRVKNIRDVDPRKQKGSRVHSKAYERLKTIICTGGVTVETYIPMTFLVMYKHGSIQCRMNLRFGTQMAPQHFPKNIISGPMTCHFNGHSDRDCVIFTLLSC